jgi:hypothetical protein
MMHLKNLVTTAPIPNSDGWHTAVLTIGPAQAEDLLQNNAGNRNVSPMTLARYAATMRNGDWQMSPEPLVFAPSGRLLNGQHRLRSVLASGTTQPFLCVFAVPENVFAVLDRGKPRTVAQAHNMPQTLAEAARVTATVMTDIKGQRDMVTDAEIPRAARIIQEAHDMLIASTGRKAAVFGIAAFRAAAAGRILAGERVGFVVDLYRNLNMTNISLLPPVAEPAMKAIGKKRWHSLGGAQNVMLNFARAWDFFRESGKDRTALRDPDVAKTVAEARQVFLHAERAMSLANIKAETRA